MEIIALLLALGIVVLTVLWFYRPVAEPQKLENVGIVKQPPASLGKNQKNVKHLKVKQVITHEHHELDINTLKGHGDGVTGISFSPDGSHLVTACGDRVVRVFHLEDVTAKSFRFLRINLPTGQIPVKATFASSESDVVISCVNALSEASILLYSTGKSSNSKEKTAVKLPPPEVQWEQKSAHEKKSILTLSSAVGVQGSILASCSEGTDIKLWAGESGKLLGQVDTNQLKNTMAVLSPDGKFLAAAAFTADVKIWEIVRDKGGAFKEIQKVMQLNGHKSAVTWLAFTWDSRGVVTASKDGTVKVWNIDVRYHQSEDPKCVKTFPVSKALNPSGLYEILAVSPDNRVLVASFHRGLLWQSLESGELLSVAPNAHEGDINSLVWGPKPFSIGSDKTLVLASCSSDKRVKLWKMPKT